MKNYRPVSNLPFLSKLLERIAQSRLQTFLDRNGLTPKTQSAYRQYHRTETFVNKVYYFMTYFRRLRFTTVSGVL